MGMTELTVKEFFNKYAFALSKTGLGGRLGKDAAGIDKYITDYAESDQLEALEREIHALGQELMNIELVTPEHKIGFEEMIRRAATYKPPKNPAAVAMGKAGGLKGGPARAEKLSWQERSAIAKKGAAARWKKKK